jgi:hypothetical protein
MNDIHIHYSEVHQTLRLSFTKDKLKHESTYTPEPAKWRMWLCAYHDAHAYGDVNKTMSAYFDIVEDFSELMHIQLQKSMVARDKLSIGCSNDSCDMLRAKFCGWFEQYLLDDEWEEIMKIAKGEN